MRPNQKNNNRSRGRGRGNKQNQNPLNRSYDSNGPDVRIRGNAAHIAEKYSALARDSLSAGDTVMAENYLQHAEHYNRIIQAAQAARDEEMAQREADRSDRDTQKSEQADDNGNDLDTAEASDDDPNAQEQPRRRKPRRKPKSDLALDASQDDEADGNVDQAEAEQPSIELDALPKEAEAAE